MVSQWNNAFETHIPLIDNQHKEIFRLLRDLEQIVLTKCEQYSYDTLVNTLCEIRDYATYHFYAEEELMRQYAYPEYADHVKSHQQFTQKINAINYIELKQNPLSTIHQIHVDVQDYIMHHILLMDTAFGQYICNHKITLDI
ncbi:MAG: bacteriohemerythrin [Cellulosilyticaceae bacterium]